MFIGKKQWENSCEGAAKTRYESETYSLIRTPTTEIVVPEGWQFLGFSFGSSSQIPNHRIFNSEPNNSSRNGLTTKVVQHVELYTHDFFQSQLMAKCWLTDAAKLFLDKKVLREKVESKVWGYRKVLTTFARRIRREVYLENTGRRFGRLRLVRTVMKLSV